LLGKTIIRFETTLESVAAVDHRFPVAGRRVETVEPRGKHLLIKFVAPGATDADRANPLLPLADGEPHDAPPASRRPLVLHTHMRMTGSWHVYRPGEAWRKPARQARVTLYTEDFVVPCFNAPVVELLSAREAERLPAVAELGPDAMTEEFDALAARERLRRRPEVEIGVALLDQRAMAGVGNVYKSEVLFLKRVSPFIKVAALDDETLDALVAESHRLMRLNADRGARRTLFGLNDRDRLWVYGRSGEPCRECGDTVRMRRQGLDARSTYFCPRCQGTR